jgi:hypothetical protein
MKSSNPSPDFVHEFMKQHTSEPMKKSLVDAMQGESRFESGAYTQYVSISNRLSTPQRAARGFFGPQAEFECHWVH